MKPKVPKDLPEWHDPRVGAPDRVFFTLTMLSHFMGVISHGSRWADRLVTLLDSRYPELPTHHLGTLEGWKTHPVWAPRLHGE